MSEIVPFHGIAVATAGRLDVRAMTRHSTAPFGAAEPFADLIETVRKNSTPEIRRCKNRRPGAAIAIRKAVAGRLDAVGDALDRLSVVMLAPDEENVRQILGAMMLVFHAQPTPTSGFFMDALVMDLREPEDGHPFSLPAIAAAAREAWQNLQGPPSIAAFLTYVRKHQARIEVVRGEICGVIDAADWADEVAPS